MRQQELMNFFYNANPGYDELLEFLEQKEMIYPPSKRRLEKHVLPCGSQEGLFLICPPALTCAPFFCCPNPLDGRIIGIDVDQNLNWLAILWQFDDFPGLHLYDWTHKKFVEFDTENLINMRLSQLRFSDSNDVLICFDEINEVDCYINLDFESKKISLSWEQSPVH